MKPIPQRRPDRPPIDYLPREPRFDDLRRLFESNRMTGAEERDRGIREVSASNRTWMDRAWAELLVIAEDPPVVALTGEDIRYGIALKIGEPAHPNSWGALIMHAARAEVLLPTGQFVAMGHVPSHARKTAVYRFAGKPKEMT